MSKKLDNTSKEEIVDAAKSSPKADQSLDKKQGSSKNKD